MKLPFKKTKDGVSISVKVEPRSSKCEIRGVMEGDVVKVRLTAPPVDNAANEQLVELLSETLGIRKTAIRVVRGLTSKNKVVEIKGVDSA